MTNIQPCPSCVETIVKWLRSEQGKGSDAGVDYADGFADQIEAIWLPKSPAQLLAEECPHGMTEEQAQWVLDQGYTKPFDFTDPRNFREAYAELTTPTDAALRYVFGPWVSASCLRCDIPSGANYQWRDKDHDTGEICARSEDGTWAEGVEIRRAYRIGQSYPHDGGECPLADGSVRVLIENNYGQILNMPASQLNWKGITSFTPLDQGSGQ